MIQLASRFFSKGYSWASFSCEHFQYSLRAHCAYYMQSVLSTMTYKANSIVVSLALVC